MATVAVPLTLFPRVSLLGREASITHGIGVAVAAATLLLVSVPASRHLLQRYPVKTLALAKYAGQIVEEITLLRRLRYTFNGPPTIQIGYDNVSHLKLDFFNYEELD